MPLKTQKVYKIPLTDKSTFMSYTENPITTKTKTAHLMIPKSDNSDLNYAQSALK